MIGNLICLDSTGARAGNLKFRQVPITVQSVSQVSSRRSQVVSLVETFLRVLMVNC